MLNVEWLRGELTENEWVNRKKKREIYLDVWKKEDFRTWKQSDDGESEEWSGILAIHSVGILLICSSKNSHHIFDKPSYVSQKSMRIDFVSVFMTRIADFSDF